MQLVTPDGLRRATEAERRCTVVPIVNANSMLVNTLATMWATKTPEEAHALPARRDGD